MNFSPGSEKNDGVTVRREAAFLYREGSNFVFMDCVTYDQFEVTEKQIGNAAAFLKEGLEGIVLTYFFDRLIGLQLPPVLELEVIAVAPDMSASSELILATLETGVAIATPAWIRVGHRIRIASDSGKFLSISGRTEQ